MKKAILASLAVALACATAAAPAFGDTLYTDGSSTDAGAGTISSVFVLSDSFTLSQTQTITSADFVAWVDEGQSVTSVEWSIGTSFFDSSLGTATADPTAGPPESLAGYSIYEETFSIPSLTLGPGTYYLTLQDAVASDSGSVGWDYSNGSSKAESYDPLNPPFAQYEPSAAANTFNILGPAGTATPEPSSLMLLATGLLGLGVAARTSRRLSARA